MANSFKNIKKKLRRKRLLAEKHHLERTQAGNQGRVAAKKKIKAVLRKRKAVLKPVAVVLAVAIVILAGFLFMEKRTYHNYKIQVASEQEDTVSTKYTNLAGKILRYSSEEVSLVNNKLETVWSQTYDMQNPVADVCGDCAVIADKDGTSMVFLDKNGITGTVSTSYSIVKAKVSRSGMAAAILDGEDHTWINFYNLDGSLIAENQTNIQDPGYPMDIALADNGVVMMVAYQFVDNSQTTSYVAFYNFGEVGQNEDNRIVSGYTYDGVVVPQIQYLGRNAVALRDDGFTIYSGRQIPKELKTVQVEKEIVSTFFDDENIGLVFKNDSKDKQYTMQVYSSEGKLKFSRDFNIPYSSIRMSDDYIIMYNSSQICVLNKNGTEKYFGNVDGTVKDFFKLGWNKYLLVMDTGVNVIKLS
nr:DUF5711 family protein [uncultured Blautia sp.]